MLVRAPVKVPALPPAPTPVKPTWGLRRALTWNFKTIFLLSLAAGLAAGTASALLGYISMDYAVYSVGMVGLAALIAITGQAERVLLAIILLDVPFALDFNPLYDPFFASVGAITGYNISLTTLCLPVLYLIWLMKSASKANSAPALPLFPKSALWLPILWIVFNLLSILAAESPMMSVYSLFLLIQSLLLYIYLVANIKTSADLNYILFFLFLGITLESLLMIGLRIYGQSFSFAGFNARVDPDLRVGGTLGGPNTASTYLSMLLPLCASYFLLVRQHKPILTTLSLTGFILGVVALFLTLSRGGWVSFAIALFLFLFIILYFRRVSAKILLLGMFILALLLLFQDLITSRITGFDAGSAETRLYLMDIAFRMIRDHPILGVGLNNYALVMLSYFANYNRSVYLTVVHNDFVRVWAEIGPGGLLTFIAFHLYLIQRGWAAWRQKDVLFGAVALGLMVALIGHTAHMLVESFHGRVLMELYWLIAGIITAASYQNHTYLDSSEAAP